MDGGPSVGLGDHQQLSFERTLAYFGRERSDRHRLRIGLSIGIGLYPIDGTDEVSLLGNADAALSSALRDR